MFLWSFDLNCWIVVSTRHLSNLSFSSPVACRFSIEQLHLIISLLVRIFFAFDEGRTLPNLLGYLLSRRFPVYARRKLTRDFSFHGSPFRRHFEWRHNFVHAKRKLTRVFSFHGSPFRRHFECAKHSASCFVVCRTCWKVQALSFCLVLRCLSDMLEVQALSFCLVLRCLSDVLEGSSCLVGKLFCYVVKKFRRCNLSKPEESVCHFWTLYINQIVFCFERFAMFDRTDPLWS